MCTKDAIFALWIIKHPHDHLSNTPNYTESFRVSSHCSLRTETLHLILQPKTSPRHPPQKWHTTAVRGSEQWLVKTPRKAWSSAEQHVHSDWGGCCKSQDKPQDTVSLQPKPLRIQILENKKNNCCLLSDKFIILKAYTLSSALHAAIWWNG